jgi:putative transposase
MEKFRGKYRIPPARLQTWDYGSNALYFITICTKNRKHFFGEIANGQMMLSEIGRLAEKYWHEIPEHFPFVILDEFVVMPNHIHGIIEIAKTNGATETNDAVNNVETQNFASLQPPPPPPPPPIHSIKTNLVRNQKIWHPSCAGIK